MRGIKPQKHCAVHMTVFVLHVMCHSGSPDTNNGVNWVTVADWLCQTAGEMEVKGWRKVGG